VYAKKKKRFELKAHQIFETENKLTIVINNVYYLLWHLEIVKNQIKKFGLIAPTSSTFSPSSSE
jgi:hypothetical protein